MAMYAPRLRSKPLPHGRLESLVLAMPISWKGTLQQYAGRLHRQHGPKSNV